MIVPDLSKTLKPSREDVESPAPTPEPTTTGTTRLVPVNASEFGRRRKRFDRSSASSLFSASPGRSVPATSSAKQGLAERQTCASGLTYYACANGFTGCCQGNPCTQTAQCSVEEPTTSSGSSTAQPSRSATSGTRTATGSASGTATSSGAATTIASATATPAPTCPGAPSNFTDSLGIAYQVKCNIDNGGSYNETIKVNAGGYAQCCTACSSSSECVGFTFFGENGNNTTAGTCYVRSAMSASEDFNSDSYAVSLYKVDPSAVATTPVPSSSASAAANSSNKSNTGAIAGGVVGGVAAVVLLLALFAFFVRRHRKKVDARHAAEKKTPLPTSNPAATERYSDRIAGGHHHRSGSTANDIYTPQGGFHDYNHPPSTTDEYALTAVPATNKKADHFSELEGHSSTPPGLRAEGGRSMIPAGVLRPPQMLDSRSVGGGGAAASRSSVFLEHTPEMEDTSYGGGGRQTMSITSPYSSKAVESPTLGNPSGSTTSLADETRRRQHLLYWNNYDSGQLNDQDGGGGGQMSATLMPKTPPSARLTPGTAQISSDDTGGGGTHDSGFVASPLNVRKSERSSSPSYQHDQPPRRGTS